MDRKTKVMIVDDELGFLEITKMNLEHTDRYEVMTLPDAKKLIPKLHDFEPDIIVLDIMMPGIDGLSACEMLNSDPLGMKTPVIVLSALIGDRDKLKAYKLGIVDYLTKPIDKNTLIEGIEKALKFKKQ